MFANHGLDEIHCLDLQLLAWLMNKSETYKYEEREKCRVKTMEKITITCGRILNSSLPPKDIGI